MSRLRKLLVFFRLADAPPVPVPLRTRVAPPMRHTTSATVQPLAPQYSPDRQPWTRPAPRVLVRPEPSHRPETPWPPVGMPAYPAWDPTTGRPADPDTWTGRSEEPFTGPASPAPQVAPEQAAVRDSGWPTPDPCSSGYSGGGSGASDSGSSSSGTSTDSGSSGSCGGTE
jgi:uncharacterized membrane protein YgcG